MDPESSHKTSHKKIIYTACVITASDRASRGVYEDASGPVLVDYLERHGYEVVSTSVVPDEQDQIVTALQAAVAADTALIVTTGGTGFSPRDVTPEATCEVCERLAPGIPEAMRAASRAITPHACLSREVAGLCGRSLIINLPGSSKACIENLDAVIGAVAHGLTTLREKNVSCGHPASSQE